MKIGIASDHRGVDEKKTIHEYLESKGYEVTDYSPENTPTDDYPDFAFMVGHAIQSGEIDFGLLVCRTGIGASIAANKVKGVRCAKVDSAEDASLSRIDNDANCLTFACLKPFEEIKVILDTFFETAYSDHERHIRRVNKINAYDENR